MEEGRRKEGKYVREGIPARNRDRIKNRETEKEKEKNRQTDT